jgi:hypothetical protein
VVDEAERQLDRLLKRLRFALLARLHPELRAVHDDRDRMWAMWFATDGPPGWRRWLGLAFVWVIAPAAISAGAMIAISAAGLRLQAMTLPVLLCLWIAAALAAGWAMEAVRRPRVRGRFLLALRISGHDVCPECGYSMVGHAAQRDRLRTCPECGGDVPPPPSMAMTRLTR